MRGHNIPFCGVIRKIIFQLSSLPPLPGPLYNQLQVPTTESAILICSENEEGKYMFAKSVGRLSTDHQLCCYMNDVTLVSDHMAVRFAGKHSLRQVVCTDI